jgi:hypothetical protein
MPKRTGTKPRSTREENSLEQSTKKMDQLLADIDTGKLPSAKEQLNDL